MKENMGLFDVYKNQPGPFVRERASNWAIVIGLQRVDGLNVSEFLIRIARQERVLTHVDNLITVSLASQPPYT